MTDHSQKTDQTTTAPSTKKPRLMGQLSVYGLGGVLSKACAFLLLPFYTRFLAPGNYGTLEILNVLVALLGVIIGFCISSGYVREFPEASEKQRCLLFGSAWWFTSLTCLVIGVPLAAYLHTFSAWFQETDARSRYLLLSMMTAALSGHSILMLRHLVVPQRPHTYLGVTIGAQCVTLVIAVWLVGMLKRGVEGVLLAQLAGGALECGVLMVVTIRRPMLRANRSSLARMLKYSVPLIPMQLSSIIMLLSDRWFLGHYNAIDHVGIYGVGNKVAQLTGILAVYPLTALTPHIFAIASDDRRCRRFLANAVRFYLAGIISIAAPVAVMAPELVSLLSTSSYSGASAVIFVISAAHVVYGLIIVVSYGFHVCRRTGLTSVFWCIGAATNLLLNSILIPPFGMAGAAWATLISYVAVLSLYVRVLRNVYPLPLPAHRVLPLVFAAVLVCAITEIVPMHWAQKAGVLGAGGLAFFVSSYLRRPEKRAIWRRLCSVRDSWPIRKDGRK